jgi:Uma2 family endonuclease
MSALLTPPPETIRLAEYERIDSNGTPSELVRGRIVEMNPPTPYHGWVCGNVNGILRAFVRAQKLGRVMSNDSGVVTESDPDTLRGADAAFYSFARLPPGPFSRDEYLSVVPDFIVEVLSPNDRWSHVFAKVTEYLKAGVTAVCLLDPNPTSAGATVYRDRRAPEAFGPDAELTVPDVLPGFRVRVGEFWE